MMTEFKAWHKELKKMFLVESLKYLTYSRNEIQLTLVENSFDSEGERPVQVEIECNIKDVVLLSYIGIKDLHGEKIFVGDIIKQANWIGIVKFNLGVFYYELSKPVNPMLYIKGATYWDTKIGNIYENPELLK